MFHADGDSCSSQSVFVAANPVPRNENLRNLKIFCRLIAAERMRDSESMRTRQTRKTKPPRAAGGPGARNAASRSAPPRGRSPAARACGPILRARILEAAKTLNYAIPASIADRKVILAASSVAMIDYVRNQFTFYVLEGLNERAQALGVEIADAADLEPGRGDRACCEEAQRQ